MNSVVGIDIGGTKTAFAVYDQGFSLRAHVELRTADLPVGSLDFLSELIHRVQDFLPPDCSAVGVATKGLVHKGTLIEGSLYGIEPINFPLEQYLAGILKCPVRVLNDLQPLAIAEARFGVGIFHSCFTVVNIGTGLGLAHWDGGLLQGFKGAAGDLYKLKTYVPELRSEVRYEELLSGKGLEMASTKYNPRSLSSQEILQCSDPDQPGWTQKSIFIKYLSELCLKITDFYNPSCIVLAGSLAKSAPFFIDELLQNYRQLADPHTQAEKICVSAIPRANCLGAAIIASGSRSESIDFAER